MIGTSVPVVAINAGAGGWLAWGTAAVFILPVALSISLLARRYATSGGLYGLTTKALGPLGGLLTGGLKLVLQRRRPRAVLHSGSVAHRGVRLGGSHDVHDERGRGRSQGVVAHTSEWPSNLVVALFVSASVAICVSYSRLRSRRSPVLDRIGTTVVEDDAALPANAVTTRTP